MADLNEHNDPLEQLFKKKADEFDIAYREEDWHKLEQRLDQTDSAYAQRRRRWIAAAVLAVVFSVLAYFTYENYQMINELNERLTTNEDIVNPAPPTLPSDRTQQSDKQAKEKTTTGSPGLAAGTESEKETADDPTLTNSVNSSLQRSSAVKQPKGNQLAAVTTIEHVDLVHSESAIGFGGRHPAISAAKPSINSYSSNASSIPNETVSDPSLATTAHMRYPTIVGIVLGPDLSTVGSVNNFYDPGFKLGITVDHQITDRFAISTGAIHSKVQYVADGGEYKAPSGYWTNGIVPDETVGKCMLIDIPISLKYEVFQFKESKLYASAGFSSYIMLNEDYRFKYNSGTYGATSQRWQKRTGTTHWFSNATLSVGYEWSLSPRVYLRAEPFIKLPLKEVGWGRVQLYSVGSLISLNYGLTY